MTDVNSRVIIFDTETTGFQPGNICQLSYIVVDGKDIQAKNFFFKVDYVEEGARRVHGFSVEDLKRLSKGEVFSCRAAEIFTDFNSADVLVGHNITFDLKFIMTEFERNNKYLPSKELFCTMKHFTPICKLPGKNKYKYPKLPELSDFLEIKKKEIDGIVNEIFGCPKTASHDARYDTSETYLCWIKGIENGCIDKNYCNKIELVDDITTQNGNNKTINANNLVHN